MGKKEYSIIKEMTEVLDSANKLSSDEEKKQKGVSGNSGIHITNNIAGDVKISVNVVNIYKSN